MVTTRKNSHANSGSSEEPRPSTQSLEEQTNKAAALPKKTKSKNTAGRKRKTEELASEYSKDEKSIKLSKKVTGGEGSEGNQSERPLTQTLDQGGVLDKTQGDEKGIEEDIEEGIEDTEMIEAAKILEDKSEQQLKAESKSAVSVSSTRKGKTGRSAIMEKGIMYFFFRSKVAVEHAESLDDVQRSYIILRPLPLGATLKDGKVPDEGRNRLIAVPKKKLPMRGYDKFLTFVEEPKISNEDLKNRILKGSTYMTKTQGERTNSAMELVGEGIYAITKGENERSSHLAYILTLPSSLGELQKDFGLKKRGSFVVNVRNPSISAAPQAGIPDPAEYSKEIMDEFHGLKWGALSPKHLDYKHAEVLFIGEKEIPKEGEHKASAEEMEKLEEEDEMRVTHLHGDEAVFADLELSKKEFVGIESTW